MISALLGIFTSGGFGAITGLIGSHLAKVEERKLAELNNSHEASMATIDIQLSKLEYKQALAVADKNIELSQVEGAIASDVAEMGNISQAIKAQSLSSGVPAVDAVLRFVRPAITAYLLVMTTLVAMKMDEIVGGLDSLPVSEVFALYVYIIESVVFLTITAVAWWFGSRGGLKRAKN